MSNNDQVGDVVQWLDKEVDRYTKIERLTGAVISQKTTPGPYKNIHIAKRRPSIRDKETLAAKPKKVRKPRRVNYLNNKDLLIEVEKSKKLNPPTMTPKLAHMLQTLAKRYAQKPNFSNYTYNDDMQAYALLSLVKTWQAFNPERSQNPFAFFTQCIKNSFIQFLKQETKHRNIRDQLMVDQGLDPSYAYQQKHEEELAQARSATSDDVSSDSTNMTETTSN